MADQVAAAAAEAIEEEVPGRFVAGRLTVQCLECGNVLEGEVVNGCDGEEDVDGDLAIDCPTCTTTLGHRAVVPVRVLAGVQCELLEEPEAEPPAEEKTPDVPADVQPK